jgi:hypothetical protein
VKRNFPGRRIDTRSFQEVKYMCYIGLFKRIIPFVLTFAAGLFIASFFVSLALPGANWRSGRRFNKHQEIRRLQAENDSLREKNRLLEMQNEQLQLQRNEREWSPDVYVPVVPPVEFDEHHPPKRPKQPRRDILQ